MTPPPISVIVPVYNGARHLRETLNSILNQTWREFELVAVDDGSKDNSAEIIRSLNDPRIRLVQQENRGLCAALNRAIEESRGTFIARTDQDDISFPHRLQRQLEIMGAHPDAAGLYAYYTKFGLKRGWSNADKMDTRRGDIVELDPIKDGCVLGSTQFIRRDALLKIGGYRQACYPADDWDLEFRLCESSRVLLLREAIMAYRFHAGANTYPLFALMQDKAAWVEHCHWQRAHGAPEPAFDQFLAARKENCWRRWQRRRVNSGKLHMRLAGQHYLDGRDLLAASRLITAFILDPGNLVRRVRNLARS